MYFIRYRVVVWLLLTALLANGQENGAPVVEFCRPGCKGKAPGRGLELEYGIFPDVNRRSEVFSTVNGSKTERIERIKGKLKIPVIFKDHINLLVGVGHSRENYRSRGIDPVNATLLGDMDNRTLKSSELGVYFNRSLSKTVYWNLKMAAVFNGDYKGLISLDNRYANYQLGTVLGIKKREERELGIGLLVLKGFRKSGIYPFLMYNLTFNEHWGIETVLPVRIKGRYNFEIGRILTFSLEYSSDEYAMDWSGNANNTASVVHLKRARLEMVWEYQHQLSRWIWIYGKAGMTQPFNNRFSNVPSNGLNNGKIHFRPVSGPFFNIGFFIAPPE